MTFPVADAAYNPKVEVKEIDDREFNEAGVLIGGGVRTVTLVDGKEYTSKTLAEVDAEQQAAKADPALVTTEGFTPPPVNPTPSTETPEDGPSLAELNAQADQIIEHSEPVAQQ